MVSTEPCVIICNSFLLSQISYLLQNEHKIPDVLRRTKRSSSVSTDTSIICVTDNPQMIARCASSLDQMLTKVLFLTDCDNESTKDGMHFVRHRQRGTINSHCVDRHSYDIMIKYNQILHKLRKFRQLDVSRIASISGLLVLMNDSEIGLSNRLIQNSLDMPLSGFNKSESGGEEDCIKKAKQVEASFIRLRDDEAVRIARLVSGHRDVPQEYHCGPSGSTGDNSDGHHGTEAPLSDSPSSSVHSSTYQYSQQLDLQALLAVEPLGELEEVVAQLLLGSGSAAFSTSARVAAEVAMDLSVAGLTLAQLDAAFDNACGPGHGAEASTGRTVVLDSICDLPVEADVRDSPLFRHMQLRWCAETAGAGGDASEELGVLRGRNAEVLRRTAEACERSQCPYDIRHAATRPHEVL